MKILLSKPYMSEKAIKSAVSVMRSGWLAHGKKVTEFESLFAEYTGVKRAVSLNSCTSALQLVIQALGITGEVIVPSFTFVASANSIVTAGAKPVFCDIDFDTCNMSIGSLESLITKNTEAIMPVHFAGQTCKMDAIMKIAKKHGLAVIEDSAETIGGTFKGKKAGAFGIGCFSFFPTKNMTTAEGGMVTTNDTALADKISRIRAHGIKRTPGNPAWKREAFYAGYNYRLNNVLAALGVEHIKILDRLNDKRRALASAYNKALKNVPGLSFPKEDRGCTHVYQMYTVKLLDRAINRDSVVNALNASGIEASVHFDPPVHLQSYYRKKCYLPSPLPVTEKVSGSIITLPMHPSLSFRDITLVSKKLAAILEKRN